MEEFADNDVANNKSDERLWESKDRLRVETAISELRSFCKTIQAENSFARFEKQLSQELGKSPYISIAHTVQYETLQPALAGSEFKPKSIWTSPSSLETTSTPTSRVSSINAEATSAVGARIFYGRGGITKSKTTGHLASLIPMIHTKSIAVTTSNTPKPNYKDFSSHRRKTSYFDCSPETRARAMKEREDRAARRVAEVRRRSEGKLLPSGKSSNTLQPHRLAITTSPEFQQQQRECPFETLAADIKAEMNSGNAVVGGEREVQHSIRSAPIAFAKGEAHAQTNQVGGLEKGRRKAERQFSGEIVKSLFGAGMREMKKMGKRVGRGRVWSESHEDLSSPSDK